MNEILDHLDDLKEQVARLKLETRALLDKQDELYADLRDADTFTSGVMLERNSLRTQNNLLEKESSDVYALLADSLGWTRIVGGPYSIGSALRAAKQITSGNSVSSALVLKKPECPYCRGMGWVPSMTEADTDPCPKCEGGISPQSAKGVAREPAAQDSESPTKQNG